MTKTTMLAALDLNGELRPTCVGCSQMLYLCGALVKVGDWPIIKQHPEEFVFSVWRLAEGYSLDNCRKLIGKRHLDSKPWGAP